MDNNISFSKIVATPTLNSWSQAYNAGKFFAVLSLEKTQDLPPEIESLNTLGKDVLERLEQEFFVIEDKNLDSIKKAISVVFHNAVEGVTFSFAAGALINNILYLFGMGNSKVFIKRAGELGLALDTQSSNPQDITSSSGFLKDEDLIVLTTNAFSEVITEDDLKSNLETTEPSEIAESLAPKIHKSENGKISAIVIKYKNPVAEKVVDEIEQIVEPAAQIQDEETEKPISPIYKYFSLIKSRFGKPNFKFQPTKKLFLIVAIAIVLVLGLSISFAIKEQNNAKMRAVFAEIYPQAQKKYEEGQTLVDLNKNYARDSLQTAQKILQDNLTKFPPKSKELTQSQDLLTKIQSELSKVSPIDASGLDRSKLSVTIQNGSGIEGAAGKFADALKEFGYDIVSTANADNYDYTGVTIKIKSSNSDYLNILKKDLSKNYIVTSSSSDLPSDSSSSAIIIIGK